MSTRGVPRQPMTRQVPGTMTRVRPGPVYRVDDPPSPADVPDEMKSDPEVFPPIPAPVKTDDPDGMDYLLPFVTRGRRVTPAFTEEET